MKRKSTNITSFKTVHDSRYKRIRHLDIFDDSCYLNIKTPRLDCDRDGLKH